MSGCRYCSGSSVRYVVYVRSEANRPSTKGIACTSILACDCADDTQRRAMSAGYKKPEEKSPATNAREFARNADAQGMINGIHWAIDPTPRTQRLMMQAWPYPSSPLAPMAPKAMALLQAQLGYTPAEEAPPVARYATQDAPEAIRPPIRAPEPAPSDSTATEEPPPFDPDDWRDNYPSWMDGGLSLD